MPVRLTFLSSRGGVPPVPASCLSEVRVWRDHEGRPCVYGYRVDEGWAVEVPRVAVFRFGRRGGVAAFPYPGAGQRRVRDVYRLGILPLVLQSRGTEVLHASAVVAGRGVLGLCGISGTGKSTVAYGLSLRGYPLWADDAVAFKAARDNIESIPLEFSVRLDAPSARVFGLSRNGESAVTNGVRPEQERQGSRRLAAVCVLERLGPGRGSTVEVSLLDPVRAFVALLRHAYYLDLDDMGRKSGMMHQYLELAGAVPVFLVRFRAGIERLGAVLDAIERTVCNA